mgnify:CR=1 FL=1
MRIKVYNENGIVKITKILGNRNEEITMFSNLKNGEVVTIEVNIHISSNGKKDSINS